MDNIKHCLVDEKQSKFKKGTIFMSKRYMCKTLAQLRCRGEQPVALVRRGVRTTTSNTERIEVETRRVLGTMPAADRHEN